MTLRVLRPSLAATIAFGLGACTPAGQLYDQVPTRLGEPVAIAGDTLYRLAGRGYVLLAARREALPDVKQALDVAAVRWRGFFGAEPPAVTVLVRDSSIAELDDDDLRGLGPGRVIELGVPAPEPRPATPSPAGPVRTPIRRAPAEPVADAWVLAFADSVAGNTSGRRLDRIRIPGWLRDGLVELVGGSGMPEVAASRLRNDDRLLTLAELFAGEPPPPAPAAERPRRRTLEDALADPRERHRLQSALVTQFLIERGGLRVPGELLAQLARGRSIEQALGAAGITPADPEALERPWREWLGATGSGRRR